MNLSVRFALGLLLLPSLSGAFEPPRLNFGDYNTPGFEAKTFYQSIRAVYRYENDPALDSSLVRILDSLGYVKDAVARTYSWGETVEATVRTDASDRLEGLDTRSLSGKDINDVRATYYRNAQGKIELVVVRGIQDSSQADSTVYTWRHPKCADKRTSRNSIRQISWTVDDQGRCHVGMERSWSEADQAWTIRGTRTWTWGPSGPTQEVTTRDDLDTTRIHRITYENGLPVRDTVTYPGSGVNSRQVCENTYAQGKFQEQRCHTEEGAFSSVVVLSLQKPAGVVFRPARSLLAIEAAALPGIVRFSNQSKDRVQLQVVRISGARMETLVLEPGHTITLPAASGSLLWRATSPGASRSGVLHAVR